MNAQQLALDELEVPLPPSEVHGLAVGLLCSEESTRAKSLWFRELLESAGIEAVAAHADALRRVDAWFGGIVAELNAADLAWQPLVPGEGAALAERVRALGDFCGGFTYGVSLGLGNQGNRPLPVETREILDDFQAIDGVDADGDDEQDEAAFAELLEYVRVGVLFILEELRPAEAAPIGATEDPSSPGTAH
ncbi:MAG: hypothetical protein CSB44_01480 [Gammaproteobacteria bacterium]|nr:MAG: hypothetical protein CSB44_01480 [Gammaproteobacteria bacterium]